MDKIGKQITYELLKQKVLDNTVTDMQFLAYFRYVKYQVCGGDNWEFKKFLAPLWSWNRKAICKRMDGIGPIVMSPIYKKPRKKY